MIHVPLNASRRLRAGLTSLALAAGWTTAAGQTAPAGQEASAGPEVIRLSPFTVDSSRDVGYRANNSISGTRSSVPIADIPMNIQVVTSAMLEDLGVNTPTEALRYFGSVTNARGARGDDGGVDLDGTNSLFGGVRLRGLTSGVNLRNGLRTFTQPLAAFVDRVELVKGPAAVLYGLSEPTGIYNSIMKRPLLHRDLTKVSARYGSEGNYGTTVDVNRRLGERVAFRVNASWSHLDSEFWFNEGEEFAIMPQVTWRPYENTEVTYEFLYDDRKRAYPDQRHTYSRNFAIPGLPSAPGMEIALYEDPRFDIDPRFSFTGPDSKRFVRTITHQLAVSQRIGEHLDLQLQADYTERPHNEERQQSALIANGNSTFWTDADPAVPFMLARWQRYENRNWVRSAVATAVHKTDFEAGALGRVASTLTLGAQYFADEFYRRESNDQTDRRQRDASGNVIASTNIPANVTDPRLRQNNPTLNGGLFDDRSNRPAPGLWFNYIPLRMDVDLSRPSDVVLNKLPPGSGSFVSLANANRVENEFTSVWASWLGKFWEDRLILTGGVFRTEIDQKTGNTEADIKPFYARGATLPQYGAIVRPVPGVGFFALYSESLQPNSSARDKNNNPFPPRFGKGTEFGVKVDLWDGLLSGTLSRWDIEQTNRVVFDPDEPNPNNPSGLGANVARGLNTSQGWEVDLIVTWKRNLQTMLSYAWIDVFSGGETQNLALNGAAEIGSYREGFGLITNYRFESGPLSGLSVGLGVNYKSDEVAEIPQAFNGNRQRRVPGVWDGNLFAGYAHRWAGQDWRWRLNVSNLFEVERPVGWDPRFTNDLGVADRPFLYATSRRVDLSVTVEF